MMEESYDWHPAFVSLDEEAVRQETEWLYVDVESCRVVTGTTGESTSTGGREEDPETETETGTETGIAAAPGLAIVGANLCHSGAHVLSSSAESSPVVVMTQPHDLLVLVRCYACGREPRDAVESPCCGEVLCWACLVSEWPTKCSLCHASVAPEAYKPAKAIERLIKLVKEWKTAPPALPPPPPPPPPVDKILIEPLDLVFPCPDECGAVLPLDELDEHLAACPAEEPCPNGCFAQLKRREVLTHLANECPLTFVQCRFGCEEQMLRREADEHANENLTKHMSHLLIRIEAQEQKMTELQQKINEGWTNSEAIVTSIREWLAACSRNLCRSLNGASAWPLVVLVLMLASALLLLPGLFVLELVLRNLPPAFAPLILPVGATVSVGIVTFLFSFYCIVC